MWNEGEDETSQGGGGVMWSCPLGHGPAHWGVVPPTGVWSRPLRCGPARWGRVWSCLLRCGSYSGTIKLHAYSI